MRSKIFIILGALVAVVAIIAAIYFFVSSHGGGGGLFGTSNNGPAGDPEASLPVQQAVAGLPTTPTFAIGTPQGTVMVNNFYLSNPTATNGGQVVVLASSTSVFITYDLMDSSFWVGIDPTVFVVQRTAAEKQLLTILGVSQADACKLDVSIGTFYSASSTTNGQSFPLSFCGDASGK